MAKLLCFLTLLTVCAGAQTVEGSVFDAATGAGIGGVKVELLKGATPFYETATDGAGRFRFDNIREGDYAARYQASDYWLTAGPSDYRSFRVAAGSPMKLEVRLMPWSRISGRVVDDRGKGVANARLELTGSGMLVNGRTYLRTSWGSGGGGQLSTSSLVMSHAGNADAQGRFQVQLMPGAYGLSALPPPDWKPPDREPGRSGVSLAAHLLSRRGHSAECIEDRSFARRRRRGRRAEAARRARACGSRSRAQSRWHARAEGGDYPGRSLPRRLRGIETRRHIRVSVRGRRRMALLRRSPKGLR